MAIPDQVKEMAAKVKAGEQAKTTVRTLLSWFGAHRRSWGNVMRIRRALDETGLTTLPDFRAQYIDGDIVFQPKQVAPVSTEVSAGEGISLEDAVNVELVQTAEVLCPVRLADPAHRISRLESANRPPVFVRPDATIEEATTLMLGHDYSQLPVMQSDRDVKGLFSWKSLGSRLASGKQCSNVRDSMDDHQEISSNGSLFEAIRIIAEHDCVLVRASDKTICGIVTAYDIGAQFHQIAEPFLLLADTENHIRHLISKAFTVAELQQAKDPQDQNRSIQDVSDLTFGEYVRLLQNEQNWAKLNVRIDRKIFTGWLEKVRDVRNDVMHFDPDPMDPTDLRLLRDFARFLVRWQQLRS